MFSKEDKAYVSDFLNRAVKKISIMAPQIGSEFPTTDGNPIVWDPHGKNAVIHFWTNAFWPGMMWLMYIKTGDESYKKIAEGCEEKLDRALSNFVGVHHDVGFMWSLSALADYKLTGNKTSRARALHAATILAGRFNHVAKYIRAWDHSSLRIAIIDSMMNLPLLFWAGREYKDPRFAQIGRAHADTTLSTFIRPDGSVNHIVQFDPETGDVICADGGQGYGEGSSWSRGHGWAIYGFALAYRNTGDTKYLDASKRVAHYFIANMEDGKLPLIDFRAPAEPVYYDASAASIAVCGLIEIANAVDELEKPMYERVIMKLLRVLDENCNYNPEELRFLENSSGSYHSTSFHLPHIYGDYYLLEALMKLDGNDGSFWVHEQ